MRDICFDEAGSLLDKIPILLWLLSRQSNNSYDRWTFQSCWWNGSTCSVASKLGRVPSLYVSDLPVESIIFELYSQSRFTAKGSLRCHWDSVQPPHPSQQRLAFWTRAGGFCPAKNFTLFDSRGRRTKKPRYFPLIFQRSILMFKKLTTNHSLM